MVEMSVERARKVIAEITRREKISIELSPDANTAKEEASLYLTFEELAGNIELYTALYVIASAPAEKIVRRTVKDLHNKARRHEDIPRSKPFRKTN